MQRMTRKEIERICFANLLASEEARIFFKDLDSRFLLVSRGWLAAEGQGRRLEDVVGRTDFDIFTEEHARAAFEDEQRIIATGEPMVDRIERETYADRSDSWVAATKLPLLDDDGRVIGTFGMARDVSAQMRDALTGLANRVALLDRLGQAVAALERQPGSVALLFIDIDGFKTINDTFGHRAGDLVLVEIARRLARVARRFDTVARYGGDEFVLLSTALADESGLGVIGNRVMRAVRGPVEVGTISLEVTLSVGGVVVSDPEVEPEQLLADADAAMYAAKGAGPGRFEISAEPRRPAGARAPSGAGRRGQVTGRRRPAGRPDPASD